MSHKADALEHLRVIRSLMEQAHVYRAISAPAALVGGGLALGLSIWQLRAGLALREAASPLAFALPWLVLLVLVSGFNTLLLRREARLRGRPFVSAGMRAALRALCPPLVVGGVLGLGLMLRFHNLTLGALVWVLCHGLALLATASFSPRSLLRLGWGFVAVGLALFLAWLADDRVRLLPSDEAPAAVVLGLTFGLQHVAYAVAVFLRRPTDPDAHD